MKNRFFGVDSYAKPLKPVPKLGIGQHRPPLRAKPSLRVSWAISPLALPECLCIAYSGFMDQLLSRRPFLMALARRGAKSLASTLDC